MSDEDSNASDVEEEPEYEVERILAESIADRKVVYLVKWQNYDDNQCTWEPAENFLTPDTLADWQRQLANNDTLDEDEVAGVQARMDAFQNRQQEDAVDHDPGKSQPTTKRLRDSSPTSTQPAAKRPRDASPAAKNPHSHVTAKPKKRSAQMFQSDQVSSVSSIAPKPRTNIVNIPASASDKQGSPTISFAPKPTSKPVNVVQPAQQRGPSVAAASKPAVSKVTKVSVPVGSRKLSSSDGAAKPSHIKNLTGQRFRNLSHQNNYAKKARQEPAPDMSKLDLRSPNEWSTGGIGPTSKTTGTVPSIEDRGSPLFVPEHESELRFRPEESPSEKDTQDKPENTVAASKSSEVVNTSQEHHTEPVNWATSGSVHVTSTVEKHVTSTKSGNTVSTKSWTSAASESKPTSGSRPAIMPRIPDSLNVEKAAQNGRDPAGVTERRSSTTRVVSEGQATSNATTYAFAERRPPPVRRESRDPIESDRDEPVLPPKFQEVVNPHQSFKDKQVLLRFGAHEVGEATLLGLPQWFSGKLNGIKENFAPVVMIYFQEQYVMNVKDFANFALHLDKRQHGHFAVEAAGSTSTAIESLCQYLESNDVGAIWEYPQPGDSLILVIYSCRAPGWQHLGQAKTRDARLHVALLNKVPGFFLVNAPVRNDQPVAYKRNADPPQPHPDVGRPRLQLSISDDASYVQSPTNLPTPLTAAPIDRAPTFLAQTPKSPGRRETMPYSKSMDWTPSTPAAESHVSFSANFERMVDGLDKQQRPRIFIAFAKARPAEAKAVTDWLIQHLGARYIFSDNQKDEWTEFLGELVSNPGLILFHDRYPCYCDIPHLYKFLKPASLWCFNVSFRNRDEPLSRLFPRGNVLCITEDSLLHHSEGALAAMEWFERGSINKEQFWKLVLPPDFVSWVLRQANMVDEKVQVRHMDMLETWYDLRKRSSKASSTKGRRYEDPDKMLRDRTMVDDDQLLLSPKDLPKYVDWDTADMRHDAVCARDTAFLKYFIGWSVVNVSKYRNFTVVDAKHTNKTQHQSWHIYFREPASYERQEEK
ncbi:hypothetical protein H2200_013571 [Cladophialophora chaetospira]|uniref:Chromo domain-containing protein n=1 Tax=Cladophialophora chaetospira TaxID=386627 RepID=A0AA38UDV3_9EURO|nr:hypothetical protein H2200_013571 [Cladophialophora chaetospira]